MSAGKTRPAKAKARVPLASKFDQDSIIERLTEALCVVECVAVSLEVCDRSGPELPALQCALRNLHIVHSRLNEG